MHYAPDGRRRPRNVAAVDIFNGEDRVVQCLCTRIRVDLGCVGEHRVPVSTTHVDDNAPAVVLCTPVQTFKTFLTTTVSSVVYVIHMSVV